MADSASSIVDQVVAGNSAAAMVNSLYDALSPGLLGGRRAATTTGLTWGYYGGRMLINGVPSAIANGTVALTASVVNYVGMTQAGTVVVSTVNRNPLHAPLYAIVAGASAVTSYFDERSSDMWTRMTHGIATQAMADANQTMTHPHSLCQTIVTTGALTAQRNYVVPLLRRQWTIRNNCTGFGVQAIGASGTGTVIGAGKVAVVECDGTNVLRVTADA